jgi:hypothetical protein
MHKSIARFEPLATVPLEEAERHYTEVHMAYARRMFMHQTSSVEQYVPQRVLAQYDIAGGFAQRPDAWRFIVLRHDEPYYVPAEWHTLTSNDHQNCLEAIHSHIVSREQVLDDRRSGQTTSAKYLVTFGSEAAERSGDVATMLETLVETFRRAPGSRLLISNDIEEERGVTGLARPAQRTTSERRRSDLQLVLEVYFDSHRYGREFFADEAVRVALLTGSGLAPVAAYLVEEEIGYDRR